MAAEIGNKYAEKWTEEKVLEKLEHIHERVINEKIPFVGIIFRDMGLYRELWYHWKKRFQDNSKVINLIKKIEENLEANIVESGLYGKTNNTMSIFVLKAHYGWKDKQYIDAEVSGSNTIELSVEEIKDNFEMIEQKIKEDQ